MSTQEKGATLIEFSFAAIILMLLLGALFDIGIGMHNWLLLRHVTEESSRNIAVDLATGSCDVKARLETGATHKLRNILGADAKEKELSWSYKLEKSNLTYPLLHINASFSSPCFFLCPIFPNGLPVSASSAATVETSRCNNITGLEFTI